LGINLGNPLENCKEQIDDFTRKLLEKEKGFEILQIEYDDLKKKG
jgi:hypothetical protein